MKIALVGNPNCGKSTLFNQLTGSNEKIGNYSGVTVEQKSSTVVINDCSVEVIDLPGIYGLTAYSEDEKIALEYFLTQSIDLIINVVDATNIERNLFLTLQLLELGIPIIIVLNMHDIALKNGIKIDSCKLKPFLNVPSMPCVARTGKGVDKLQFVIKNHLGKPFQNNFKINYTDPLEENLSRIQEIIKKTSPNLKLKSRWLAIKLVEDGQGNISEENLVKRLNDNSQDIIKHFLLATEPDNKMVDIISSSRFKYIQSLSAKCISRPKTVSTTGTENIDMLLTNRVIGPILLLFILWAAYTFAFSVGDYLTGYIEDFFSWLKLLVNSALPEGLLKSLITSGIIDGVGGVLSFIPLIMLMFLVIGAIEESGYMARVAFMLDRVLRIFGLHGSSILAYILSGGIAGGCAVPGVMATRTLKNPKERMATLLTVPFMNCGGKLPVYALLIAAFFSEHRGSAMFIITLFSWLIALLMAGILRATILK